MNADHFRQEMAFGEGQTRITAFYSSLFGQGRFGLSYKEPVVCGYSFNRFLLAADFDMENLVLERVLRSDELGARLERGTYGISFTDGAKPVMERPQWTQRAIDDTVTLALRAADVAPYLPEEHAQNLDSVRRDLQLIVLPYLRSNQIRERRVLKFLAELVS